MKTVSVPNPDGSVTVKKVVECLDDEPATQTVTVCDADKNICTEKELPAQVDIDASLPRGCEKKIISSQHPDGTFSEKEVVVCEGDETGPPPETQNVVVCDLDEGVCEERRCQDTLISKEQCRMNVNSQELLSLTQTAPSATTNSLLAKMNSTDESNLKSESTKILMNIF